MPHLVSWALILIVLTSILVFSTFLTLQNKVRLLFWTWLRRLTNFDVWWRTIELQSIEAQLLVLRIYFQLISIVNFLSCRIKCGIEFILAWTLCIESLAYFDWAEFFDVIDIARGNIRYAGKLFCNLQMIVGTCLFLKLIQANILRIRQVYGVACVDGRVLLCQIGVLRI